MSKKFVKNRDAKSGKYGKQVCAVSVTNEEKDSRWFHVLSFLHNLLYYKQRLHMPLTIST